MELQAMFWPFLFAIMLLSLGYILYQRKEFPGLRILMYHKLHPHHSDFLTVSTKEFENQMQWLFQEGYHFMTFGDIIRIRKEGMKIPQKSVVVTFDDGYQNNFDLLLPLLIRYRFKATIFLPVGFVGKMNQWDEGSEHIMSWDTLEQAKEYFEYGIHSYDHKNMGEMEEAAFTTDLETCLKEVKERGLPIAPVLSYPYGRFPKQREKLIKFQKILKELGFEMAVRIGNKINPIPFHNPYLLCRIDIRGTDSWINFRTKVKRGKLNIF